MKIFLTNTTHQDVIGRGAFHYVVSDQNDQNLVHVKPKSTPAFLPAHDIDSFLFTLMKAGKFDPANNTIDIDEGKLYLLLATSNLASYVPIFLKEHNSFRSLVDFDNPTVSKVHEIGFGLNFDSSGKMFFSTTVVETRAKGVTCVPIDNQTPAGLPNPYFHNFVKINPIIDATYSTFLAFSNLHNSGVVHADPHRGNRILEWDNGWVVTFIDTDSLVAIPNEAKNDLVLMANLRADAFGSSLLFMLEQIEKSLKQSDTKAAFFDEFKEFADWQLSELGFTRDESNMSFSRTSIFDKHVLSEENFDILKKNVKIFLHSKNLLSPEELNDLAPNDRYQNFKTKEFPLMIHEKRIKADFWTLKIINSMSYATTQNPFCPVPAEDDLWAIKQSCPHIEICHTIEDIETGKGKWIAVDKAQCKTFIIDESEAKEYINTHGEEKFIGHILPCNKNLNIKAQYITSMTFERKENLLVYTGLEIPKEYVMQYKNRHKHVMDEMTRPVQSIFKQTHASFSCVGDALVDAHEKLKVSQQQRFVVPQSVLIEQNRFIQSANTTLSNPSRITQEKSKHSLILKMHNSNLQVKQTKLYQNIHFQTFYDKWKDVYSNIAFANSSKVRKKLVKDKEKDAQYDNNLVIINSTKLRTLDVYGRTVTVELNTLGSGCSRYVRDVNGEIMFKKRTNSWGDTSDLSKNEKKNEKIDLFLRYANTEEKINGIKKGIENNGELTEDNINDFISKNGTTLDFLGLQNTNIHGKLASCGFCPWQISLGSKLLGAIHKCQSQNPNEAAALQKIFTKTVMDTNGKAIDVNKLLTHHLPKLQQDIMKLTLNAGLITLIPETTNELIEANEQFAQSISEHVPITMIQLETDKEHLSTSAKFEKESKDKQVKMQQELQVNTDLDMEIDSQFQ